MHQSKFADLIKEQHKLRSSSLSGMARAFQEQDLAYQIKQIRRKAEEDQETILEPCPFCGLADIVIRKTDIQIRPSYYAYCMNCESEGPADEDEEKCKHKWNKRYV